MTRHVPSALMRQTLLDRELVRPVADVPVVRLLPWLDVVVLGGRAVIDRGRDVLLPLLDELRTEFRRRKMLILTGAGIRARHVLGVGLDLGLPTGALAGLAATEAEQNGHMVAALLAADGVSYLSHSAVARRLAVHLAAAPAVVAGAYPPFGTQELPSPVGRIPRHRTDAGALLLADALGARSLVYVKDVDGLVGPDGGVRRRVPAGEAAGGPLDPRTLELLGRARHVRELRIVNGLVRGTLAAALAGEEVGTVVQAD